MIGNTHGFASTKPDDFTAHLKRGRPGDPGKYTYTGRATESRGYHRPAGCSSDQVSATLEPQGNDGFTMSTEDPNSAMRVSVRWTEQSGQTELVVSNSNPEDGFRVEQKFPLPGNVWSEEDWEQFNDSQLEQHTWLDGFTPFEALERPLIAGEGINKIQVAATNAGVSIALGDEDQYLISHGVMHLTNNQKDRSLQPRNPGQSKENKSISKPSIQLPQEENSPAPGPSPKNQKPSSVLVDGWTLALTKDNTPGTYRL